VYDYVAGKADWLAMGLPSEGSGACTARIGDRARTDVPRYRLGERVVDVGVRMAGWEVAAVVDEHGVVLGMLDSEAVADHADRTVAEAMHEGPSTFRPDVGVAELGRHLREQDDSLALVTRSDGTLVGLVRVDDLPDDDHRHRHA
jgi:hypothetical protein